MITVKDFKRMRTAYTVSKTTAVRSLDFHYNGEFFLYSNDSKITILHLTESKVLSTIIDLDRHGVGLCKFYGLDLILHSCKKNYLRLIDHGKQEYIRYFPGHSKQVTSIGITSKLIASGSEDTTIRLWDPRKQEHIKIMKFPSTPLVAFHPYSFSVNINHIFAVAYNSSIIEIFTTNNTEKSENKFEFVRLDGVKWTSLNFSPDGSKLIVTTNSSLIKIIDALSGQEINGLKGKLRYCSFKGIIEIF